MTGMLGKIVNDLARDASSTAVRIAVFKGLAYLLDNPLSLVGPTLLCAGNAASLLTTRDRA